MPSSASPFTYAIRRCAGFFQTSSDQGPLASPPDEPMIVNDMHDASSPPSFGASSSDGDWNDAADHGVPTFGLAQLKAGFVLLYYLVGALVAKVTIIASDVVSLKDRIAAVEGTQTPALVCGQEGEALARLVNALFERVAFQEDRIADLEDSKRAEADAYQRTIQGLTTTLDNMEVVNDYKRKARDEAFQNLSQSFKILQRSTECQAARVTGIKADAARKIALLQSELAAVQTELSAIKMIALPANVSSAGQAAKEARRTRILESVARQMEDVEITKGSEFSPPSFTVVGLHDACA